MCGVVVGSIALVSVLSVFNGFQSVIEDLFSNFDPQIKIVATSGKVFEPDSIAHALNREDIEHTCYVIEDNALLKFGEKQLPVTIKGVPEDYTKVTGIDSILVEGEFSTKEMYTPSPSIPIALTYSVSVILIAIGTTFPSASS